MPKLSGIFTNFPGLDKVPIDNIIRWLKIKPEVHSLQDYIANRLLYPQTIPLTQQDLEIDLALLREALILEPSHIFIPNKKKIVIPEDMENRFPPLEKLTMAITEAINPAGVTSIYVYRDNISVQVGVIARPEILNSPNELDVFIDNKMIRFATGGVSIFPLPPKPLTIKIATLEPFTVSGGDVGLILDLRGGK